MLRKKSKIISISTSVSAIAVIALSLILTSNVLQVNAGDTINAATYTKGIDISHWQGTINWNSVYADGYRFAFCKATEGITYDDPTFSTNMNGGTNAGVIMGAYHFAHPDSNSATSEAAHFVSIINEYMTDGYLRPVLDLEDGYTLGRTALTDWVITFMSYVETQTGIEPLIYCNLNYASNYLDSRATAYDLWIARLGVSSPETGVWDDWTVWQYSWTGTVSGISGDVDLDYYNGDLSSLMTSLVIGGYEEIQYDRAAVYDYTSIWWNDRNPLYFDYSDYGGDCANFVSQCIIAGGINLLEGTDGNGFGVDNYGTMPFCDYLNLNLRNYQDTTVTYVVEGSAYVPDEVTIGDVVIFGEDNADNWEHAMVVISDNGNDVGLAGHSSNVWGRSFWTELGYSTFDCATFYHINSVIGGDDDTDDPATVYWPILRSGSQGEDVRSLQYLLSAHGYTLVIDGKFGPETESTVKTFQSDTGIEIDGIVGSQTWSTLIITLKEGSSGDAVIALQRQLKYTYEYPLTIDGEFGPETRSTVIAFQNDAKIGVDGIVGPTTWKYVLGLKVGSTTGDTGDTGDPGDIPDDETVYWPTLRTGSQGEDVYTLQYLLTARNIS